jgi:hypothetical protein
MREGVEGKDSAESNHVDRQVPATRAGGKGLLIALAITVPLAVLGMWFSDRIGGYFALHAWSTAGPRQLLDSFSEALKAKDASAIERMSTGPVECATDEAGRFTVKLAGGPMKGPPKPAAALTPSVPAAQADLRYDLANAEISTQVPSAADGHVTYVLVRQGGAWKVKMALPSGLPGQ